LKKQQSAKQKFAKNKQFFSKTSPKISNPRYYSLHVTLCFNEKVLFFDTNFEIHGILDMMYFP